MGEERIRGVGPSGIDVAYERFGDRDAPPVLLVAGLATQLLSWNEELCAEIVGHGLQVIRYDNRDAGLSSHLRDASAPDLPAALSGDLSSACYTLSDLAADGVGLLDALGLDGAHLVGASMGGQIAQTIAIEHPGRARSLTSISSTTGAGTVGRPGPEALRALAGPPITNRQEAMDRSVAVSRALGSPGFVFDEARVRERAGLAYDRAEPDPPGIVRQAVATVASGDRTPRLRSLVLPTLVLHGADDPMVDVSGGRATAEAVPGAELVVFEGMGHDLPRALWPEIAARIAGLVRRAEANTAGG